MPIDQTILDQVLDNPPVKMRQILKIPNGPERDRQIALWACEFGFDDLRLKPFPTPPEEMRSYMALSDHERKTMNKHPDKYIKFWDNANVRKYLNDCNMVSNINISNKKWLETYLSWLDKTTDAEQVSQITQRLYEFESAFSRPTSQVSANWHDQEEQ